MARIGVIGGGVVGISCALALLDDRHAVTVFDPGPPGEGASWASCGSIAVSEVVPLSKPGTLMRVPRWLLDPTGPLTLRASALPGLLPWLCGFAANSPMSRLAAISGQLAHLSRNARRDTEDLLARHGLTSLLRETPVIEVYDGHEDLAHERRFHDMRRALGFDIEEISGRQLADLEPTIAQDFAGAAIFRDWRSVADAKGFVVALHDAFIARGGIWDAREITGFVGNGQSIEGVRGHSGEAVAADRIVIAAGTASKKFADMLGIGLRLESALGYQTSLADPGVDLNHALIYAKGGFGITPYQSGLAIAGGVEFAGLDASPNWARADILVQKAKRVLPGLRTTPARKRMGSRPLTSDTKPIIGASRKAGNVIFATGHGQLGLTLAATTARLVSDIAASRPPSIDLTPYHPDRF